MLVGNGGCGMTLGTGIFASTVLVLLAMAIRQITVRHKWKLTGKIAAGFVAVCAVIGGGLYAWNYIANLPPAPSVVTELAGVKLGMSPTDVTLALGKPDTAGEPEVDKKGKTNFYYSYVLDNLIIKFSGKDKFSTKVWAICSADTGPRILGFDVAVSSEDEITRYLGKPNSVSINSAGTDKFIYYKKWNVAYGISKKTVQLKCVSESPLTYVTELLTPEEQKAADAKAAAQLTADLADAKSRLDAANLQRAKPRAKPSATSKPSPSSSEVDNTDPCALNLSEAERLRRLATYGVVRQSSDGNYYAGKHNVTYSGSYLIYCR